MNDYNNVIDVAAHLVTSPSTLTMALLLFRQVRSGIAALLVMIGFSITLFVARADPAEIRERMMEHWASVIEQPKPGRPAQVHKRDWSGKLLQKKAKKKKAKKEK